MRRASHPVNRGPQSGFTLIELLVVMVVIAVLAAIAIQTVLFAFDVSRVGATVGNMRGVATVLMDYENVSGTLPGGGLQPVSAIVPTVNVVGAPVPTRDGWGNDLWYEPVVVNGTPSFRVYSYGKDGTPDGAVPGLWLDFFTDIVNEGGAFLQTKW